MCASCSWCGDGGKCCGVCCAYCSAARLSAPAAPSLSSSGLIFASILSVGPLLVTVVIRRPSDEPPPPPPPLPLPLPLSFLLPRTVIIPPAVVDPSGGRAMPLLLLAAARAA